MPEPTRRLPNLLDTGARTVYLHPTRPLGWSLRRRLVLANLTRKAWRLPPAVPFTRRLRLHLITARWLLNPLARGCQWENVDRLAAADPGSRG